jgi:uncharacterized BrkB/YihY/UPF0761 family membrane protein
VGRLAKDAFQHFRTTDGFSHTRALAFQITFTLLPATIAVVGLATILHAGKFRDILLTPSLGWAAPRCRTSDR